MFKKLIPSLGSVAIATLPLVSTVACAKFKDLHISINVYLLPGDDPSTKTPEDVDAHISMMNQVGHMFNDSSFSELTRLEFALVDVSDDSRQTGKLNSSQLISPLDKEQAFSTFYDFIKITEDTDYLQQVNDIFIPYAEENEFDWYGVLGFEIYKLLFENIVPDEE